jgi:hypothetical protein
MPGSSKGLFATHLYQGSLSGSAALNRRLMQDVNAFSAEDKMARIGLRELSGRLHFLFVAKRYAPPLACIYGFRHGHRERKQIALPRI